MRILIATIVAFAGVAHAEKKTVTGEKLGASCGRFDPKRPLTISFRLKRETVVDGVVFTFPKAKSLEAAKEHGRVAAFSVITGDNKQRREVADPLSSPVSDVPGRPATDDGHDSPERRLQLGQPVQFIPVTTKQVTVVIEQITPGSRFRDLCVGVELTHPQGR